MEQIEIMRVSIENVRNLISNSIQLLRDTDLLLSQSGYYPLHGNTIGSETSKNMNQSAEQAGTFFPQYMSRYYTAEQGKASSTVLCVNIQFYHFNREALDPCIIAGVCSLKDESLSVQYWWLKYYAFEASTNFVADGSIFHDEDEEAAIDFWGENLALFTDNQVLQDKIVTRLLDMAKSAG
ncbi:hypothetical protein DUZ99_18675 [Xylanibacillus composti]|uniref:Uncharacterized protein n=1 Tax=Xylanibacillus composti TaxID=1572762 RepID=A0A8J4H288_9BACL|nr:hypothetical protein [Xylanibacillus composti]MDT9726994.1 hypothetical protein [Xylanibacillus composti]GIQ69554.1 hypothetical protein XYCOK13_23780 [Xylanibacillus composti]